MNAFFDGTSLDSTGSRLTLGEQQSRFYPVNLEKRESLPAICAEENLIDDESPVTVFNHFAETYAEYYAFFEERGVDWHSRVADAQQNVSNDMSDEELFNVLAGLLQPLDDGHVQLEGNGSLYRPATDRGANSIIEEAFANQDEYTDIQAFANDVSVQYWENLGSYLDEDSIRFFDGAIPDRLIWATMGDGSIGYLYIASMAFLSDEVGGLNQSANVATITELMPQVMADLENTQALIIDVRNNIGGHDDVSQVIASHFVAETTLAASRFARTASGNSETVEAWIEPADETPYLNPVAVITGVETASAAETFTMTLKSLPHVTQVGENTNGIFSDVLEKTLPNGWEIWLANEVYLDSNGVNHEVTGLTPDMEADVFSLEGIEDGRNIAIDAALEVFGITQ